MRLLLVEDDKLLGDGVRTGLVQGGYTVDWLTDGEAADEALQSEEFDGVILDINLPGISGLEVLRRARERESMVPVLLLTARDTVADRVEGLDGGADDYLIKPFDLDELLARLRAMLRRGGSGRATMTITFGELELDPAARTVKREGSVVELSQREFSLLQLLMENAGKVIPRSRLEASLYGWGEVESNTLEVYVHYLRKKLGSDLIRTVRGVGYMLKES